MKRPAISVIIPCYNAEKYLAQTLDCIVNQTLKNIEIICIDDGSTDNTPKILKQLAKKDKRIKVITQKNTGVVTARNRAIAVAKAEYIYPFDSDDLVTADCLEKLYTAMNTGQGDIITCRVAMFSKNGQHELQLPKPTKSNMVIHNCLVNATLFRKKDFDETGGYDTAFNDGIEDYDLWTNFMFRHNKKVYRVPEILFFYRVKDKSESRNAQGDAKYHQLRKYMKHKYPEMRKYIVIKWIKKIGHIIAKIFMFRIPALSIKEPTKNIKTIIH
jgi:glycosyltransferase involved in cell wall biosynthesis